MAQISDAFLLLQASSSRIAPLFNADLVVSWEWEGWRAGLAQGRGAMLPSKRGAKGRGSCHSGLVLALQTRETPGLLKRKARPPSKHPNAPSFPPSRRICAPVAHLIFALRCPPCCIHCGPRRPR
jgi:hypothetical protein